MTGFSDPDFVRFRKIERRIEALENADPWFPIQMLSTTDNVDVELRLPAGRTEVGHFASDQGRWVYSDGGAYKPLPQGIYPRAWRPVHS